MSRRAVQLAILLAGLGQAPPARAQVPDSAAVQHVLESAQRLQPGVPVRARTLDAAGLGALLEARLAAAPAIAAQRARVNSVLDEVLATELSFRPVLSWSANHDRYATYDRPAVVHARVPIAWDEENPVQADINLPNGGRGLIWLPRPTDYGDRDIIVHASRRYASELSSAAVGLSKTYQSGLQLSLMNLSLNRRWAPVSYQHPWSMGVSNRLELPLLRGHNGAGMLATMELLNEREEARLASLELRAATRGEEAELLGRYADLRAGWELYRSSSRRARLLDEQLGDVALLRERGVLTAFELVRTRDAARDAAQQTRSLAESFLLAARALDLPGRTAADTFDLYIPAAWDAAAVAADLHAQVLPLLTMAATPAYVERLPAMRAAGAVLQQARNELGFAESQQRPQLSLRGSLELFQSNDMGYHTAGQAFERAFLEPDGLIWNLGVVGSVPLGRSDRVRRDAARERVHAAEADLAGARQRGQELGRQLGMAVRGAYERLQLAETHFRSADSLATGYARPLYDARRLTRAEYASFAADVESSRMDFIAAWREYFDALLELVEFADVDLGPFRHALR